MEARQDQNGRFTLLWVSRVDGKTPVPIKVNPVTGRVLIEIVGDSAGIQPVGAPFTVWQLAVYDDTTGMQIGALDGAGYIKLVADVPTLLWAIPASDVTESTTKRFVTDTEKATWNAKQNALGYTAENSANKGQANGYAGLDATGKVPSTQLPSFVDDVLEYANLAGFPWTGETGKMYVALDTNKVYRWSGSAYIEISGSPWSTDAVTEWATNLYFTTARVLGTLLAGLSTATNAVITASDSVLSALGKLQKQISDNLGTLSALSSTVSSLSTTVAGKATDTAVVHIAGTETVTGQKKFNKIVESAMDNSTNGAGIRANGSDHIYYEWLVNLVRKAYIGFGSAGLTTFAITNEMTNGDINLATNGTGKVKVNWVEIPMSWGSGTAKICYEGFLPWVQIVGRVWLNVSGQTIATASKFKISLSTLPTGASLIVELRKNGTAIGTATVATGATATNGMYIADATTSSAIAENDKLEVYVTQVGSTVSGNDLSFQLISA